MLKNERLKAGVQGKYIPNTLDELGKNGDAYFADDYLFRCCKNKNPSLTAARYRADKAGLLKFGYLHQEGYHIYLQRTWEYEEAAADRLADVLKNVSLLGVILPEQIRCKDITLSSQQRGAVEMALNNRMSIIPGGAGSGKTTLIEAMVHFYSEQTEMHGSTVVAAPTGKAARNLTERTGIPARTVHGVLGKVPKEDFLDPIRWSYVGLVVIDEASMMSLEMLAGILNRVPKDCRIVLLGDPNQLLSVGSGNVLPSLLALGVPSIRLEQQYRQDESAEALRYNVVHFPKLNAENELRWDESFRFIPADDEEIPGIVCREAVQRYRAGESIQVLATTNNVTKFSANALNRGIQDKLNPRARNTPEWGAFRGGDRVIVTRNDNELDVSNGDVGILYILDAQDIALMDLGKRVPTWDTAEEPQNLALAYALTVHKSQGSQYDTIILMVSMSTSQMLYRNLLYTAISRAKKEVILVGGREAVTIAMQRTPAPRRSKLVAKTNMRNFLRSA